MVASNYDKSLDQNLVPPVPGFQEERLIKAAVVYGPNAGGKTNLLLALGFLRWLVVDSATGQKPEAKLPTEPFRLDRESSSAPTILELTFLAEGVRYELAVAVNRDRVIQERLVAYPKGRGQLWYDRVWNGEEKRYDWSAEKPDDFRRDPGIVEKTRENALFISTAAQWNNLQLMPVYQWFAQKLRFMNLGATSPLSHEYTAKWINESEEARDLVTRVLRSADLGLREVDATEKAHEVDAQKFLSAMREFVRQAGAPGELFSERFWQVTFKHEGEAGEAFPISWEDESAGTRRFFSVLGPWFFAVQNEQVLCVDELETSLHPVLAAELLRLLFRLTQSKSGSQLIFTTHNPLLLDMTLLRRDQVWFADKNQQGESFLYPLTDYKPRSDESLMRGYLSGRYGAVPFIPNGLVSYDVPKPISEEAQHGG